MIKNLHFRWTVSRGRDTYGYNICTLLVDGEKKGKCMGGGYDMTGTAFGEWIEKDYQPQLLDFFKKYLLYPAANSYEDGNETIAAIYPPDFYGVTLYKYADPKKNRIGLDGKYGFESIRKVAKAIGISLEWNRESDRYKNHSYYTAIID